MIVVFEFLVRSNKAERVEAIVTTAQEAASMVTLLESSDRIIVWKMVDRKTQDFGWANEASPMWGKYRPSGFRPEDYDL